MDPGNFTYVLKYIHIEKEVKLCPKRIIFAELMHHCVQSSPKKMSWRNIYLLVLLLTDLSHTCENVKKKCRYVKPSVLVLRLTCNYILRLYTVKSGTPQKNPTLHSSSSPPLASSKFAVPYLPRQGMF
ncbi:hypothetical protein KIL84_023296 [Mauremys mutica]|uniref:Uncharacterized protein n=1 Tax=Mauremys mutica TaxID=74926 RepID=A0A9D3WRA5_9SAUR|nr:hypothetical protein KIL84_023296 [Mauremys mutica]